MTTAAELRAWLAMEREAQARRAARRLAAPPSVAEIDRELERKYGALPAPNLLQGGQMLHVRCKVPDLRSGRDEEWRRMTNPPTLEFFARTAANLMALGIPRRAVIKEAIKAGYETADVVARAEVLWGEMKKQRAAETAGE